MEQHLALINTVGTTVKDVPAKDFIEAFAKHLKKGNKIKIPEWGNYVKTASRKELGPYDADWLYTRAASIAYQIYMRKKVGVNGMRQHYGGNKRMGTCKSHQSPAGGKNIRYCINQLAAKGILATVTLQNDEGASIPVGKALTQAGTTDMDRIAASIIKQRKADFAKRAESKALEAESKK
jgi:small subunit ribosomal protein S19e